MAERSQNSSRQHVSARYNTMAPGKRLFEEKEESDFFDENEA